MRNYYVFDIQSNIQCFTIHGNVLVCSIVAVIPRGLGQGRIVANSDWLVMVGIVTSHVFSLV